MTVLKHELRQNRKAFIIWTAAITFFLVICVFMYPEMEKEMTSVSDMFSQMGSFTQAFGMDKINFGTLIGFYAVECGNMLGLGGAFFAAMIGVASLAKEEKDKTAEFLFSHPVNRTSIITQKLASVMIQIILLNLIVWILSIGSVAAIGQEIPMREMTLLHLGNLFLQIEIGGICFGLSAFVRKGSLGIGLGIATVLYFMNLLKNISEDAGFLKYITPFGYTEGSDIVANGNLDISLILLGMLYMLVFIVVGYMVYCKKDIR